MTTLRLCYFTATGTELASLSQGLARLTARGGRAVIRARTRTQLFDQARSEAFVGQALDSHAIILALHGGGGSCPALAPLLAALARARDEGRPVPRLHVQPAGGDGEALLLAREHSDGLEDGTYQTLFSYLRHSGPENLASALAFLEFLVLGQGQPPPPAAPIPREGAYHPDLGLVADIGAYVRERLDPARPRVGLWFFQGSWLNGNLEHVDALIREFESRGAGVLAVFSLRFEDAALGNRGADFIVREWFMENGAARIDVLVSLLSMSMTMPRPEYRDLYPELGVPVLQALVSSNPREVWEAGDQGVSTMDVTFQAAQPEFDGALITLPVATREEDRRDPLTGGLLARYRPIPDRVRAMASLALRWAALSRTPNRDKRVAVILHNYPTRADRIGNAVGLDTFASLKHLVDRLADQGYRVDRRYADGQEVVQELLSGFLCDQRWHDPAQAASRARASAGPQEYGPWFATPPRAVREQMAANWGEAPGELFVREGRLLFPGVTNGNLFLTIQPPRGKLENLAAAYHDLKLSPPHHYLAQYRWIRDVFRADAVLHLGKHGSLEWLPGKALGLSERCYPDLILADLPNVYPYIINDPSEGAQAKRRSACVIVDHLTPPFVRADLYGDLAEVERALAEYAEAERQDPGKVPLLAGLVWEAVERADLVRDLGLSREEALVDADALIHRLHALLTEIADMPVADGLHVLGQIPAPERLPDFLVQLVRLPNGEVPSLREAILAAWGFDFALAVAEPGTVQAGPGHAPGSRTGAGLTGGQLLAESEAAARGMVAALAEADYDPAAAPAVARQALGGVFPEVERTLDYLARSLVPKILAVDEELCACVTALSGGFVAPGPSGAPTRGQADILPTGRNFYSLDPRTIPSPGAWEVGRALAQALLERALAENGRYPESVGIILWGGSTMRTRGDDIAEILHLLGVRPVWRSDGLVQGLEMMPLSELGRPRIDVVPRISGFFRDAFPLLVDLIDEAVELAAIQEESPEMNLPRRNVLADLAALEAQGMDREQAWRAATARVFGCPPGSYGAGVAELVETGQWKTRADLGEAYIQLSAHAYGRGLYGERRPEAFRRLLGRMDVTVKNEDSREYDMLTCTDFYNYHGGLIAAAALVRGSDPLSLAGDSSDPRRARVRTTHEEARHVLRARLVNPKWIEGLRRHGFKGAGELSKVLDVLLGWDATAGVVEDWMYRRVAEAYALDPAMREWFREKNPFALHNILAKLLEAMERGLWQDPGDLREELRDAFLEVEGEVEEATDEPAR
jgi:cobaltochelatase CobN